MMLRLIRACRTTLHQAVHPAPRTFRRHDDRRRLQRHHIAQAAALAYGTTKLIIVLTLVLIACDWWRTTDSCAHPITYPIPPSQGW